MSSRARRTSRPWTRATSAALVAAAGCHGPERAGADQGVGDEARRRSAATVESVLAALADESAREHATLAADLDVAEVGPGAGARRHVLGGPSAIAVGKGLGALGLEPHAPLLAQHFGPELPRALVVDELALPGRRRALLVGDGDADPGPLVVVLERTGELAWHKERPLVGVLPRPTPAGSTDWAMRSTLALGPRGGVALFWYDVPAGLVAARMWDGQGGIFADFSLLSMTSVEALTALRWPGHGWLVVAGRPGEVRAQRLGDDGRASWGANGIEIGLGERRGPATLAIDGDETVMVLQPATGADGATHLLATRLDDRGRAQWPAPADLGVAGAEPPDVRRTEAGAIDVRVASRWIRLTSSGAVRRP